MHVAPLGACSAQATRGEMRLQAPLASYFSELEIVRSNASTIDGIFVSIAPTMGHSRFALLRVNLHCIKPLSEVFTGQNWIEIDLCPTAVGVRLSSC